MAAEEPERPMLHAHYQEDQNSSSIVAEEPEHPIPHRDHREVAPKISSDFSVNNAVEQEIDAANDFSDFSINNAIEQEKDAASDFSDFSVNNAVEQETDASSDISVYDNALQGPTQDPDQFPRPNMYTLKCSLVASIPAGLLGFELGATSETIASIKKEQEISKKHAELVIGILYLVSLFGSVAAGWTSDRIGRRSTIALTGLFFLVGPLLMSVAANYGVVLLGRFVSQVGAGYTLMVAIYIAEFAPTIFRGSLSGLPEVFIGLGIMIGYLASYFFPKLPFSSWHVMLLIGMISVVFFAKAVTIMPESPRWLIMRGRSNDAERILVRITESEEKAALLLANIEESAGIQRDNNHNVVPEQSMGKWRDLFVPTRSVGHMLACATGIEMARQLCGFEMIILYNSRILEKIGVELSDKKLLLSIALEFVKVIFTLVATFSLDKIGRRRLLLGSLGGIIGSLVFLGIIFYNIDQGNLNRADPSHTKSVCIVVLLVYVASYSLGVGPITSVYNSELFPLKLRAKGCTIVFSVNQLISAFMTLAFLLLDDVLTLSRAIFFFAAVSVISWYSFFKIMPETRGRTLEDMIKFFGAFCQWEALAREIDSAEMRGPTGPGTLGRPLGELQLAE